MVLAERFAERLPPDRKSLWGVEVLTLGPGNRPRLRIKHPAGLAALAGYLKHQSRRGPLACPVLVRGECVEHGSLVPALFRDQCAEATPTLLKAEELLERKVRSQFGEMRRFRERHISAVLQHYGVRTSWVDAVDNLFIAVWFALNERQVRNRRTCYVHSSENTGWIHFLGTSVAGHPILRPRDLRREHFVHSLRPHAQHGWSITRWKREHWFGNSLDLRPYILVSVQIPNLSSFWRMSGFMFTQPFLFPPSEHDHTYRVLLRPVMSSVLREVEEEFGLNRGTLGRITQYVAAA